ncbi:MAG TPA: PLP-dependent aminotransferase family protein [Ktedonobacterales bacterium]|nr:PLP-dependent aminotransferase family protein [Ktedonobacterales bacterium]
MPKRRAAFTHPTLALDHASAVPLSRQLYDRLRHLILSGQLKAGARLPSTRDLASELGVARGTVFMAYTQLLAENYIESNVGSGTTVASFLPQEVPTTPAQASSSRTPDPPERHPLAALSQRGAALAQISFAPGTFSRESRKVRAFRVATPDLEAFPHKLWAQLAARCARAQMSDMLMSQHQAGYPPLREAIAAHLGVARGVRCSAEQVIITSGAQGAIDLAARILLDPGDAAWVEDPGYPGAKGALLGAGAQLIPVPVDEEGLDVAAGWARCQQARLAYVTPAHQFPLGVSMSLSRRLALLEWARQESAWILEDDYDSEYRYVGRPLAALQGLDEAQRVIYIGTFSKVLFPGLRLGYLVAPPALVDALLAARRFTDIHPPALEQAAVADFINEGHFTRHIRRMRALYAARRDALLNAAQRDLAGLLEVQAPETGMHVIGWLPSGIDARSAAHQAAQHQIETIPLSTLSLGGLRRSGLLLGYAAVTEEEINDGTRRLASALRSVPTA